MKDHIIAAVVNDLRDTAIKFHDTQQLRARLRACIEPLLSAAAPQVVAATDSVLETATELARCIWRDNYKHDAPQWEPLTDLHGVLSQIDNMVCGMRRAAPVQAKEPVRQTINPMGDDGDQWYFDCDGHYIDVKKDADGKYSIFFRGRSNGEEAWLDQAELAPVQPVTVPDGWKLVPIEPTAAMNRAAGKVEIDTSFHSSEYHTPDGDKIYRAMLSAVPAAPAAQGDAISQQQIAEIIDSYTDQGTKETSIDDAAEAIRAAIAAKAAS